MNYYRAVNEAYNKYLDEEISKKLCEEYNIKYTPKETKK